jgi:hypothetical protein
MDTCPLRRLRVGDPLEESFDGNLLALRDFS